MERILIVDDTPEFRTTVATLLRRRGYEVSEAGNGREAIDLINTSKPQLILLDVIMPEMGGLQLLEILKARGHLGTFPIAVFTARNEIEREHYAFLDVLGGLTAPAT